MLTSTGKKVGYTRTNSFVPKRRCHKWFQHVWRGMMWVPGYELQVVLFKRNLCSPASMVEQLAKN